MMSTSVTIILSVLLKGKDLTKIININTHTILFFSKCQKNIQPRLARFEGLAYIYFITCLVTQALKSFGCNFNFYFLLVSTLDLQEVGVVRLIENDSSQKNYWRQATLRFINLSCLDRQRRAKVTQFSASHFLSGH